MTGQTEAPDYWTIIPNYETLLTTLANRIKGRSPMVTGLEIDDLVQEGRIAVWLAVQAGKTPNKIILYKHMLNWVRKLRRQNNLREAEDV